MIKKGTYTVLSHIATWGVLFLLPMTLRQIEYPLSLIPTATVVMLFYINYLWLTPRFYMQGQKPVLWVANIVLVTILAIAMHYWLGIGRGFVFNMAVSVMIAVSMRLGSLWQESEEARLTAEAARADAELSNLRYEMNPHFLLNTLNNIYALTAFDTRRAQEAIQQLSAMLRHMLYDNMEDKVQMEDEVKFIESYIKLMKIRLPESVKVNFDASEAKNEAKIAPLILIPLVENAFKHGISPTRESFIGISLKADKEQIDFCIENSNHPKTANDESGHGIGLTQVQKRLELTYPNHYRWEYGPSADQTVYRSHLLITPTKQTD